jgi:hypothetical protein
MRLFILAGLVLLGCIPSTPFASLPVVFSGGLVAAEVTIAFDPGQVLRQVDDWQQEHRAAPEASQLTEAR